MHICWWTFKKLLELTDWMTWMGWIHCQLIDVVWMVNLNMFWELNKSGSPWGKYVPSLYPQNIPDLTWVHACVKSCLILCDPTDCSPPGSSCPLVFQARILEWVAISSSKGSSLQGIFLLRRIFPQDGTHVSCLRLLPWQAGSLPLKPPGKSPPWVHSKCLMNESMNTRATHIKAFESPDKFFQPTCWQVCRL